MACFGRVDSTKRASPESQMHNGVNSILGILAASAVGCLPVNSVQWAREPLPDASACVVEIEERERKVKVTERSRRACVAMAQVVEPEVPRLSLEALKAGPPSEHPFRSDEDVYCRLVPRPEGQGGSPKFRCLRTDAENRLYDEDGELEPGAHAFDQDGGLLDARGNPILKENGKPREGDELRVKYFAGQQPEARHREMFTETVVSHFFWALGIPVDRVYMPSSVRCFGCSADPFGQATPDSSTAPRVFRFASVERRYEGKQINIDRRRGWMGLGGGYGHGFAFGELEGLATQGPLRKVDTEILVTALNIVSYNRPSSYQNELVCRNGKWDKETGVCTESVAYVQDIGGTLGGEKARLVPGIPLSEMKNHPRGDWPTFSQERVFRDATQCRLRYDIAGVEQLSEAGRKALERRISGRIGMEELLVIFQKANIHQMDERVTAFAAEQSKLSKGPALDRHVQRMWAEAVYARLREVLDARCPA